MQLKDICCAQSSNIALKDLKHNSGPYPIYGASGFITCVDFFKVDKPYVGVVKDGAGVGRVMLLPEKSSVIGTMQSIIPTAGTDAKYLSYLLDFLDLGRFCSGATIPHIYFKDYGKETIPTHSPEQQQEISAALDKITKLIALRQGQLAKLDQLAKSRFIEMFGDPIANPKSWTTGKLSEVTDKIGSGATPQGGKESYITSGISLIRSMNIHNGKFEYKDLAHITEEQAQQLNNVNVKSKDVFINITGASVARSCVVPDDVLPARVNQHVSIIRCKQNILNPIFANSLFISLPYQRTLLAIGESGGATRQAITKQQLENLMIILPSLELQNEFSAFVEQLDKSKLADQIYEVAA